MKTYGDFYSIRCPHCGIHNKDYCLNQRLPMNLDDCTVFERQCDQCKRDFWVCLELELASEAAITREELE